MRLAKGVMVAIFVLVSYVTVPFTSPRDPAPTNVRFVELIVAGFIASLKVMFAVAFNPIPETPQLGAVATTVGGVVSGRDPVVKLHEKFEARALPERSFRPVPAVTVKVVLGVSVSEGTNNATDATAS